jgi:hypothetical protein
MFIFYWALALCLLLFTAVHLPSESNYDFISSFFHLDDARILVEKVGRRDECLCILDVHQTEKGKHKTRDARSRVYMFGYGQHKVDKVFKVL